MIYAPETTQDLADLIAKADAPMPIFGNCTRHEHAPSKGISTKAMSGILFYEPNEMVIRAKAGTPVAEVEAALLEKGQRLAFEPFDHRAIYGTTNEPTIGGMAAMNASGSRRINVGACRDHMIGVQFVNGRGEIVKSGGRVMKDVTGMDLVKLMAGSRGALGVLTEVTFKVQPMPETCVTLAFKDLDVKAGIALLSKALGSPYDVTGAAFRKNTAYIRLEGFGFSTDYRALKLGGVRVENDIWGELQTASRFKTGDLWRVSKPADKALVYENADYEWGGGIMFVETSDNLHESAHGHATLLRSNSDRQRLPTLSKGEQFITNRVKSTFDPKGLFKEVPL
jgi:glycolate oxidase FAD binding subunit